MAALELRFLGGIFIHLDNAPLTALKSKKGQALLCYLAVTGKEHSRSALSGLLWTDVSEKNARATLRKTLSRLKPHLRSHLTITRESIAFSQEAAHWLDVNEFEAGLTPESDFKRLQGAVSLYLGDFLDGFYLPDAPLFDEWVLSKRAQLREAVLQALNVLVTHFTIENDYRTAISYARRSLDIEPWHEEAHRELMGLLSLSGQRSAALMQYETCRQTLEHDLGIEPAPATVTLYEQIRQGQFGELMLAGTASSTGSVVEAQIAKQGRPIAHRLPALTTPLVGRLNERTELSARLAQSDVRLVTILGPGGIGKTHLATAVAHEIAESGRFDDGVLFVSLTSVTTRQQFVSAVADRLNLSLGSTREPEKSLLRLLRGKAHLIVLDNFEQLLTEADILELLMDEAPQSKLLLTSRERIKLREEWVLDLAGLPYPDSVQEAGAAESDAVTLFAQRARQMRSNFSLDRNLAPVVRICQLTQGMPLALEQAASWIRVSSAGDIANQIENNIDSLSTSLRYIPQRHRAMRSVFDGSWRWLSDEERSVFCRLSVFQGGFILEAAEQVTDASPPILSALIDKSLLLRSPQAGRATRYDMHELIRQYAHERLMESGEAAVRLAQESHINYFLSFAERAEKFWDTAHEGEWLQLLEAERDNFHAALRWALESGRTEQTLRLNAALFTFWIYNSPAAEASDWIEASLEMQWDERSLTMMRARAKALNVAGYIAIQTTDYERAIARFNEGLALYSTLEDQRGMAWSLRGCGFVLLIRDDLTQAQTYFERSLTMCQETQDEWGEAWSVYDLGNTALAGSELAQAQRFLEKALTRFRDQGILFGDFRALISLGHVMRGRGQWAKAEDYYRESLAIQQRTHFIQFVAQGLEGMAHIAVALKKTETGAKLFGAGQARRDSIEMARWVHQERDYQRSLALTRDKLPIDVWQVAWEEGYAMTAQQAVELALTERAKNGEPAG